jgi:DNA-binding MarR family transcriptional regulator
MEDAVDRFIAQWRRERPDLPLDAMATVGRLGRVSALGETVIEANLRRHGLRIGEFDVLAALRRLGAPHVAPPSVLTRMLMLSPAAMTNRLDRLEAAGLVERRPAPGDRRSVHVALTDAGLARVDAAATDHVALEEDLLSALTAPQRRALDDALRALLAALEARRAG